MYRRTSATQFALHPSLNCRRMKIESVRILFHPTDATFVLDECVHTVYLQCGVPITQWFWNIDVVKKRYLGQTSVLSKTCANSKVNQQLFLALDVVNLKAKAMIHHQTTQYIKYLDEKQSLLSVSNRFVTGEVTQNFTICCHWLLTGHLIDVKQLTRGYVSQ